MSRRNRLTLALAFALALLAVGLPYWQIPYAQISLPGAVWGVGLIVVAVLAAACRIAVATALWPTALVLGAAVPGAVLVRVVYEAAVTPTSHNLWPFELLLSAGPGLLAALVGALAGGLVASARRER